MTPPTILVVALTLVICFEGPDFAQNGHGFGDDDDKSR